MVMAVRALRTMAVERRLVHSTITSGVDERSEKLEAIRDVLPARRRRSGHTGRVKGSRLMMSTWWGVAGL